MPIDASTDNHPMRMQQVDDQLQAMQPDAAPAVMPVDTVYVQLRLHMHTPAGAFQQAASAADLHHICAQQHTLLTEPNTQHSASYTCNQNNSEQDTPWSTGDQTESKM